MASHFFVGGRLFNEKEVSEILKRASSIRSGEIHTGSNGISLQELQQVAGELGFDPGHIELAAKQLGPSTPSKEGFLNGRIVLDRTLEGEVTAEDWLGMVAAVQRYHKGAGAITQRGSNYDWAGSEEGGSLALTVKVRDGRSRIRLESNQWMGMLMITVFCSVFALAFSLSLVKHGYPLAALPVCLLFAGIQFGVVRGLRQHHMHSVSGLMERLIDEAQSESPVQPIQIPPQTTVKSESQEQTVLS